MNRAESFPLAVYIRIRFRCLLYCIINSAESFFPEFVRYQTVTREHSGVYIVCLYIDLYL